MGQTVQQRQDKLWARIKEVSPEKFEAKEMTTEGKPAGFKCDGKNILYIDTHGKDISFERWRLCLYYKPNFAMTHFCYSQKDYDQFIEKWSPCCYQHYEDFKENNQ